MQTNYTITKQEGKKVEVYNKQSGRTHTGTLCGNGTKVAIHNWGGRTLLTNPKIVEVA